MSRLIHKELVQKFITRKSYLTNGAGQLAKRWGVSKAEVKAAKKEAKNSIKSYMAKKGRRIGFSLEPHTPIPVSTPKVLVFDIETSPMRSYTWGRWKQNIGLSQTISEFMLLSWSAKWLYDTETISDVLTGDESLLENDGRIVKSLWDLLEEADIVIAHNGDRFDIPKFNARAVLNGLGPNSPYKSIDTLKIAKTAFSFSSNKLDALAGYFDFETKLPTSFLLWSECMEGNEESLAYMEEYNRYDVELLELVYLKLRAWDKHHPNVAVYTENNELTCRVCGSNELVSCGHHTTQLSKFEAVRCNDCGAVGRKRVTLLTKQNRSNLIMGV